MARKPPENDENDDDRDEGIEEFSRRVEYTDEEGPDDPDAATKFTADLLRGALRGNTPENAATPIQLPGAGRPGARTVDIASTLATPFATYKDGRTSHHHPPDSALVDHSGEPEPPSVEEIEEFARSIREKATASGNFGIARVDSNALSRALSKVRTIEPDVEQLAHDAAIRVGVKLWGESFPPDAVAKVQKAVSEVLQAQKEESTVLVRVNAEYALSAARHELNDKIAEAQRVNEETNRRYTKLSKASDAIVNAAPPAPTENDLEMFAQSETAMRGWFQRYAAWRHHYSTDGSDPSGRVRRS